MGHGQLSSILDSYSILGIDFFLHNPSKNTDSVGKETSKQYIKIEMIFSGSQKCLFTGPLSLRTPQSKILRK
jgi:hypothetical protein